MQDECSPDTGQTCPAGTTCGPSHLTTGETGTVTSSAVASPARTLAAGTLASNEASTVSDPGCGQSLPGYLALFDPGLQWWRTPQISLFADLDESLATFTYSGLMRNGKLYPLAPLERRTFDEGRSLFATPTVADSRERWSTLKRTKNGRSLSQDVGGVPNPEWVEWLMGFPAQWTDCDASETP
jgi:hypothetical protein